MREQLQSVAGTDVSADVLGLSRDGSTPRFIVYCLGVERALVHSIRNAYRHKYSKFSTDLAKHVGDDYSVKILGFYSTRYFRIFNMLSLTPHVIVLGRGFQAPYTDEFRAWVRKNKPSVLRLGKTKALPSHLPNADYYLGTYSVLPEAETVNVDIVSAEIDYGALLHLTYSRYVRIDDNAVVDMSKSDTRAFSRMLVAGTDVDSTFVDDSLAGMTDD